MSRKRDVPKYVIEIGVPRHLDGEKIFSPAFWKADKGDTDYAKVGKRGVCYLERDQEGNAIAFQLINYCMSKLCYVTLRISLLPGGNYTPNLIEVLRIIADSDDSCQSLCIKVDNKALFAERFPIRGKRDWTVTAWVEVLQKHRKKSASKRAFKDMLVQTLFWRVLRKCELIPECEQEIQELPVLSELLQHA